MESKDNSESINRLYAVLPCVWAEAVLPADIEYDSPRIRQYLEAEVKEAREDGVDLLEEARELALSRSAIYQQNLRLYYSRKVNPRVFREGDLVLRLVQRTAGMHKLSPHGKGHSL